MAKPNLGGLLKRLRKAPANQQVFRPAPITSQKPIGQLPGVGLPSPTDPIPRNMPATALFTREAMRRAWRAVYAARGGPGVDGMTLQMFKAQLDDELETLRQALVDGSYRPGPIRQIYVPKTHEGLRPLVIWTLRDRVAQRVVYDLIAPTFDASFLPVNFGFRTGLGTADAVRQIVHHRDQGLRWVVDADIKACFENIDLTRLQKQVWRRVYHPRLRQLIKQWLKAGARPASAGRHAGIPQGGVLSPLFANIYLHAFDQRMVDKHLALVRYADDFIICTRRKSQAQKALAHAERALHDLGLDIHPHKTRIVHFDQGFKFVGYFFVRNQVYRL